MDDMRNRLRSSGPSAPAQPKPRAVKPQPTQVDEDNFFAPVRPKPTKRAPKPKKKRKKRAVLLLVLLILGVAGFFAWRTLHTSKKQTVATSPQTSTATTNSQTALTGTIRLVAMGDFIPHSAIVNQAKIADTYEFSSMLSNLKELQNVADIRFCSLPTPAAGAAAGISGYPVFNAPTEWQPNLLGAGCNTVNLASNNTNDKGQSAIDATVAAWDGKKEALAVAGANRSQDEQTKVRYFTQKGVKFAFVAYTTFLNKKDGLTPYGVNMYSDELATTQITEARKNADVVLVSMHWGKEDVADVQPDQEAIAQKLTDMGADIVIGHGSHIVQPAKRYNGKNNHEALVWYSLGNGLNAQLPVENLVGGMAVIDIDAATKKYTIVGVLPWFSAYEWTAAQKQQGNLVARTNFSLIPLDQASDAISKAQFNTTVAAQTERVKRVFDTYLPIPILTTQQYKDSVPKN